MKLITCSHRDAPELQSEVDQLGLQIWPLFMTKDPVSLRYWQSLYVEYPEYQLAVIDEPKNRVVGMVNSIPVHWTESVDNLLDTGWDWALEQGIEQKRQGLKPTIQSALQVALLPEIQGHGVSAQMLVAMKEVGQRAGLSALVAPVRPSLKHAYPLTPMERYVEWRREDSLSFDPWMRVHERLGAKISHVCPHSMEISGTIENWEKWTGMRFPESGDYIVPKALNPVRVDRGMGQISYREPNVWMIHPM